MNTKSFHISDVLTVITGRLISTRHMDGVYDILSFMTGDNLFTHQLPRAREECIPYLLEQFPQLDTPEMQFAVGELIEMLETISDKKELDNLLLGWLSKLTSGKYGVKCEEELEVKPIPWGTHLTKDPIEEATDMIGDSKVILTFVR